MKNAFVVAADAALALALPAAASAPRRPRPRKWAGPVLSAKNSGHATEMIEIVFERLEMK